MQNRRPSNGGYGAGRAIPAAQVGWPVLIQLADPPGHKGMVYAGHNNEPGDQPECLAQIAEQLANTRGQERSNQG